MQLYVLTLPSMQEASSFQSKVAKLIISAEITARFLKREHKCHTHDEEQFYT